MRFWGGQRTLASVVAFCGALLTLRRQALDSYLPFSRMDKGLLHGKTLALRTGNFSHRSAIWGKVVLQNVGNTPQNSNTKLGDFLHANAQRRSSQYREWMNAAIHHHGGQ